MSKIAFDVMKNVSVTFAAIVAGVSSLSAGYSAYKKSNPVPMQVSYDDERKTIVAMGSRWDISLTGHYREANYKVYLMSDGLKCSFQDKAERIFHVIPHHSKESKCAPMQGSDIDEARALIVEQARDKTRLNGPGMSVT